MTLPLEWLLAGPPWIEYRARLDLLGQTADHPQVVAARRSMLEDPQVCRLIAELSAWPGIVISSHKSAGQMFHKLTFLTDLGIQAGDPGVSSIVARILEHQSLEGPFQLPTNIPAHYGGSGQDQWGWALCDAPLTVYSLAQLGLGSEPSVQTAIAYLAGLITNQGWPCVVSKELGNFRGPGRKEDPCPYATLVMLKALSRFPEWQAGPACHQGADILLSLWADSLTRHPYIFYMGNDFRKLKVPFVWYDLLHVLDVLSSFSWLRNDPRLLDMLALLKSKLDPQGCFTAESVWTAWKDWEFGQKKAPSRWLTLMAWRVIHRIELAAA